MRALMTRAPLACSLRTRSALMLSIPLESLPRALVGAFAPLIAFPTLLATPFASSFAFSFRSVKVFEPGCCDTLPVANRKGEVLISRQFESLIEAGRRGTAGESCDAERQQRRWWGRGADVREWGEGAARGSGKMLLTCQKFVRRFERRGWSRAA